jgi:hypothetical protein
MLAEAIATAVSRGLSYGTIYTTKLLRRGTDIDRPAPAGVLRDLTVGDVMRPLDLRPTAPPPGRVRPGWRCQARLAISTPRRCCSPASPCSTPCASSWPTAVMACPC